MLQSVFAFRIFGAKMIDRQVSNGNFVLIQQFVIELSCHGMMTTE